MVHTEVINSVYPRVHHLILGERMDSSKSKVSPSPRYFMRGKSPTGTIGFADFRVEEYVVPDRSDHSNRVVLKAFHVLLVGIEPEYRGIKYPLLLPELIQKMAKEFNCKCIVYGFIKSEAVMKWLKRKKLIIDGSNAVEYLD